MKYSAHHKNQSLATPLAKVKNLGGAHSGTGHFIKQRVSAIFMLFFIIWLANLVLDISYSPKDLKIIIFGSVLNIAMVIFFVGNFLYHGYLGMQMIIEDYVHSRFGLIFSLIVLKWLCIMTFISFVMAAITTLTSFISITVMTRLLQGLT
jgi:succinate dehydrogenase / fumarate reductase membrane anchor subunit